MKTMKPTVCALLAAALVLVLSCGKDGREMSPIPRGIPPGRAIVDPGIAERDSSGIYVLSYNDSVLVLYRNQKALRTISKEKSARDGGAWLAGGHVYVIWSADSVTHVQKDGKDLFSYRGRERISGFLARGGEVHTLGAGESGKGITYRIDGVGVMENPSGAVLGNPEDSVWPGALLGTDGETVCFSYMTGRGTGRKWYLCEDGEERAVRIPGYVDKVFDLRRIAGKICYVCNTRLNPYLAEIHAGDKVVQCEHGGADSVSDCSLLPLGGELYAKGLRHFPGGRSYRTLWGSDGKIVDSGAAVADYYTDGGNIASVSASKDGTVVGIHVSGRSYGPEDGILPSRRAAAYLRDTLYLALEPSSPSFNPCVWRNGARLALPRGDRILSIEIVK